MLALKHKVVQKTIRFYFILLYFDSLGITHQCVFTMVHDAFVKHFFFSITNPQRMWQPCHDQPVTPCGFTDIAFTQVSSSYCFGYFLRKQPETVRAILKARYPAILNVLLILFTLTLNYFLTVTEMIALFRQTPNNITKKIINFAVFADGLENYC